MPDSDRVVRHDAAALLLDRNETDRSSHAKVAQARLGTPRLRAEGRRKLEAGPRLEALPPSAAASGSVDELVHLAERVLQAENDRETSLNGRGATLAAVAGIIVSLSGFVADLLIIPSSTAQATAGEASGTLTRGETYVAVCMFVAALALLIVAIAISVLGVLRPGRGRTTRAFLGDAIVRMLVADPELSLVRAPPTRLKFVYVDRVLRSLPQWHFRNRRKARRLRRAYVILGLGIALIAATASLAVSRRADVPYWAVGPAFGAALLFAWLIIPTKFVSGTRDEEPLPPADDLARPTVQAILEDLRRPWEVPKVRRWRPRR